MKIEGLILKEKDKPYRLTNEAMFWESVNVLAPGRYRITVAKMKKNKSLPQLGYLYGCVYPMSHKLLLDAGWEFSSIEECDAFWKSQFANRELVNKHTGEIMSIPALKRDFTTTDMMGFCDAIRNYCAEYLNGYIPSPEEQINIDYDRKTL